MELSVDSLNQLNGTPAAAKTANDAASSDRFLKLLVAQMQNQDPLNPMDNAQVTTQMAQISTVDGIAKLNTTVQGLNGQFVQMQALQGASLVGRNVTVPGDQLTQVGAGHQGAFEIGSPADRVRVEVLNGAGSVVDTLNLGAQGIGRHGFEWNGAPAGTEGEYRFRVTANNGAAQVLSTSLMLDRVESVSFGGNALNLDLARSGALPYGQVVAFN